MFFPLIVLGTKLLAGLFAAKLAVTAVAIAVPFGREAVHREVVREQSIGINPEVIDQENIETAKAQKVLAETKIEVSPEGVIQAVAPTTVELTPEETKKAVAAGSSWARFDFDGEGLPSDLKAKYAGKWCLQFREREMLDYALSRDMNLPLPRISVSVSTLRMLSERRLADARLQKELDIADQQNEA